MLLTAIAVCSMLAGIGLVHCLAAAVCVKRMLRWRAVDVDDSKLPRVAVLMALRGADPGLLQSLKRLMRQNYPSFEIRIVVDSPGDPARPIVEQAIAETGADHVSVVPLKQRPECCGMKNASLVQLARGLDDSIEVVVFADGDVNADSNWLRDLVTPLVSDDRIGVTHGWPWYMPREACLGSLVRYLWYGTSTIPMQFRDVPWAGSMAMRYAILRDTNLVDQWSRAIVDDALVSNAAGQLKLQTKFVPSLMIVNCEDCGLRFCLNQIRRHLTWLRLYSPRAGWLGAWGHMSVTTLLLLTSVGIGSVGAAAGRPDVAVWAAAGSIAYQLSLLATILVLERTVQRIVARRGEPQLWLSLFRVAKLPFALLTMQLVCPLLLWSSSRNGTIVWRDVTYEIGGPWDILVLDAQPLTPTPTGVRGNLSA
jgi:hypothetical protein